MKRSRGGLSLKKKKVLFVCVGNICRSPMAEGFLKELLLEKFGRNPSIAVEVSSAGLSAVLGWVSGEAVEVMKERGVDISGHHSRQLTRALIDQADLVLTMKRSHKEQVLLRFPHSRGKVFTLKEFAGYNGDEDIEDPYGRGLEAYRSCADDIEEAVRKAFPRILKFLNLKDKSL